MSDASGDKHQRWFPLESNPQLMNDYVAKLGFDTTQYQFCDVYSCEDWALDMVPQPVAAVILLYPLNEKQHAASPQQQQQQQQQDQQLAAAVAVEEQQQQFLNHNNIWFTKQRIGNACGTIGILHALQNAPMAYKAAIQPDSWLHKFAADTPVDMDPIQKAQRLETDAHIATWHDQATASDTNATERGNLDDDLDTHFIALCHHAGRLYELDGRKAGPVDHGATSDQTLLKDAVRVIQNTFMKRDPTEVRFTMLALAPAANQNE